MTHEEETRNFLERDDDDYEGYGGSSGCNRCGGAGWVIVCPDDMCRGAGECMHGDGEIPCPDCDGDL